MKELQELLSHLIQDGAAKCSTKVQMKDLRVATARLQHEGLSFLTITLPNFLDDFMLSIEEGKVTSDRFIGWKKRSCLPAFLQGFTSLVFAQTGGILNEPNHHAVHVIRQICSFAKKIKLDCTYRREQKALEDYCLVDDSLEGAPLRVSNSSYTAFVETSRILWGQVFGREVELDSFIPHHGPGSTQEGIQGNQKYAQGSFSWPTRLARLFDPSLSLFNSEESHFLSDVNIPHLEVSEELPVRVTTVPKTLKAPRIIALEPVAMQMAQQSVKDFVVRELETNPLTSGHINFTDQTINQRLALASSRQRHYATLDLSAASDRVHKDFIWRMLSVNPVLRDLFFTTRSACAQLPGGELKYLNKFASMGSALCFPAEAMFFTTLCVVASLKHKAIPPSLSSIRRCIRDIYVYGDDIIVPTSVVETVVATLHEFGNVVSMKKSFFKGFFRESCGIDAFCGHVVTPVYVRNPIPNRREKASAIISTIETANQLFTTGFENAATYLRKKVEALVGNLPIVSSCSSGLGWWAWCHEQCKARRRFNKRLQRVEVRTLVPKLSLKKDEISGYSALFKCLLQGELKPERGRRLPWHSYWEILNAQLAVSKDHLKASSRRGAVALQHRWVPLY